MVPYLILSSPGAWSPGGGRVLVEAAVRSQELVWEAGAEAFSEERGWGHFLFRAGAVV